MIEFVGELYDDLGVVGTGEVSIVEEGDEWEGDIALDVVPSSAVLTLKQDGKERGTVKIDFVESEDEKFYAHFMGVGPLSRV